MASTSCCALPRLSRRRFLAQSSCGLLATAGLMTAGLVRPRRAIAGANELKITRIVVQDAPGRRATPVAPNAFAEYRGYEVTEPLVRIQTNQGLEGLTRRLNPERDRSQLQKLIGLNPFELFDWNGEYYAGPAEPYRQLLTAGGLGGIDLALFDLLGKALERPVADLFGPRVRAAVDVYDSSLYMDDLLTPEQRTGLVYLEGHAMPEHDAELVARKAEWLVGQHYREEGLRIFKIKTGRARWMASYREALERDIAVFRAVRHAVGPHFTLFVDVNNGYRQDPTAGKRFIEETSDVQLFGLEEMFDEREVARHREVMEHAWSLGLRIRNIDGETRGIPSAVLAETISTPRGERSLFDINNPSFSHGLGFVQVAQIAAECRPLGIRIAPHNFASKIGFVASVQLGFSVPNWAFVEIDDSRFPALRYPGLEICNGRARLTGAPGLGVEVVDETALSPPRYEIGPS